mmetsp:Transcript_5922/g.5240  ORF Transcript_5922/g.5240 Transcript_5922/m.5240 type:complete len:104 (+) Transcript_5922:265-576(+)
MFQVIMIIISPLVIIPIFYKLTKLSNDDEYKELCGKIDDLAKENEFPIKDVMKMDGSTRSAHSNAFFTGIFGSKKIVLFDTLLKQCNQEEIIAIICHEIGHFK